MSPDAETIAHSIGFSDAARFMGCPMISVASASVTGAHALVSAGAAGAAAWVATVPAGPAAGDAPDASAWGAGPAQPATNVAAAATSANRFFTHTLLGFGRTGETASDSSVAEIERARGGILPGNEVDMGRMWVAGEWCDAADGRVFEVVNPATEEPIDTAPRAGAADVDRAVAAAARAFPDWRRTPGIERAEKLHDVARRIREDAEGLAILLTREGGKPLPENRDEIEWIAASLRLLRGDRPRRGRAA